MQKSFWLVMIVAIVGMFGLFALTGDKSESGTVAAETYDPTVIQLTDHIANVDVSTQEELDAAQEGRVVIVEYADYQCPACQYFAGIMDQIKQDFGDKILVVFRNFPLTNIHPQSLAAHRAAEAAAKQGAFWEMHDLLYIRQDSWVGATNATDVFNDFAVELGLDMEQFAEDRDSAEVYDRINVDVDSARPYHLSATPTVFVSGEKLDSVPSYEEITKIINDELTKIES